MFNIIVADDDKTARDGLGQFIRDSQSSVDNIYYAQNGEEVLEILEDHNIDLVISDIKMPIMDGISLATYISQYYGALPLVLFSAYSDFEYARDAIKHGVLEYLLKPIDYKSLEALNRIISAQAEAKEKMLHFTMLVRDTTFASDIRQALENNDSHTLQKILDKKMFSDSLSIHLVKEYYSVIIKTVSDYTSELGIQQIPKDEIMRELLEINDYIKLKEYVSKTVTGALHFINVYKHNQSGLLVEYIDQFIRSNYHKNDISTATVSQHFGISISYLCVLFKERFNMTLTKYITKIRMEHASHLLQNTNLPVYEIAERVGYTDHNYFTRSFKRFQGVTPLEFRKNK